MKTYEKPDLKALALAIRDYRDDLLKGDHEKDIHIHMDLSGNWSVHENDTNTDLRSFWWQGTVTDTDNTVEFNRIAERAIADLESSMVETYAEAASAYPEDKGHQETLDMLLTIHPYERCVCSICQQAMVDDNFDNLPV